MPSYPPDIARQLAALTTEMRMLKKLLAGSNVRSGQGVTTALTTLTTTYQSLISLNVNVKNANASIIVFGTIDWNVTTAAAGNATGAFTIDGVVPSGQGQQIIQNTSSTTRQTLSQTWYVEDLTVGNRTLELKAQKGAAGAAVQVAAVHTTLSYILFDR